MSVPSTPSIAIRPAVSSTTIKYYFGPANPTDDASSFSLTCSGPGGGTVSLPNTERYYTFTGLTIGSNYQAFIVANNAFGTSDSNVYRTVTCCTRPSPPSTGTISTIAGNVNLTWTTPLSDGNGQIGWYVIQNMSTNMLSNVTGEKREHIVFGEGGCNYVYNVYSVNDAGYSSGFTFNDRFNPMTLSNSMVFWNSASNLGLSCNADVINWNSIVGSNNAISQTFTYAKYITNALNGYPVVRYTPNSYHNISNLNLYSNYTFIALSRQTGGLNNRVFGCLTVNTLIGYWAGNKDSLYLQGNPADLTPRGSDTEWDIYSLEIASDTAFNWLRFGTQLLSNNSSSPLIPSLTFNGTFLGSEFSDCEIAEVFMFQPALTTLQRQKIEGYLAWNYGLQSNLDSNHPYRNSYPNP